MIILVEVVIFPFAETELVGKTVNAEFVAVEVVMIVNAESVVVEAVKSEIVVLAEVLSMMFVDSLLFLNVALIPYSLHPMANII